MKYISIIAFVLILSNYSAFSEKYSLIEPDSSDISKLSSWDELGIESSDILRNGENLSFIADDYVKGILLKKGIKFKVLVDDYSQFLADRANAYQDKNPNTLAGDSLYGSMGGFFTLDELYARYDTLVSRFPDIASKEIIGKSYEGRNIYAYRFGNFKSASPMGFPEVLFTSLHHAREPGGASVLLFFIEHLFDKYSQNIEEAKYLLDHRNITVVPAVNPDGYEYNRSKYPNGGGLWRKNRRKVNDTTYGVDINRNYGPMEFWNSSVGGSSTNPAMNTYRGEAPFSEPETQAIQTLCEKSNFKIAVNYHTYGNMLVYPWGVLSTDTPDSLLFRKFAYFTSSINKYIYGLDKQTLNYQTQGSSDDWMYLQNEKKGKILAFTTEVGNTYDNFWCKRERIYPLCLENLRPNYEFLWSADYNFKILNFNFDRMQDENAILKLEVANIGAGTPPKTNIMKLKSLNDSIIVLNPQYFITALASGESDYPEFRLSCQNGFDNGGFVGFEAAIQQNGISRKDTFFVRLFKPETTILFDSTTYEWALGTWGIEYDSTINQNVLTDSPNKNSTNNFDSYATYNQAIDLRSFHRADLVFSSKWFIEQNWDAGVVEISTDSGINWLNLSSPRMTKGLGMKSSKQKEDMNFFEGNNFDYSVQTVNLDEYCGNIIQLRFGLLADKSGSYNGWMISSALINKYDKYTSMAELLPTESKHENIIVHRGEKIIKIVENLGGGRFYLCNALGKTIASGSVSQDFIEIETSGITLGSYFLILEIGGKTTPITCLIVE